MAQEKPEQWLICAGQAAQQGQDYSIWTNIKKMIDALIVEDRTITASVWQNYGREDSSRTSLQVIYYMYKSIYTGPNDMLKYLFAFIPSLEQEFKRFGKIFEEKLGKYVFALAEQALSNSRFYFTTPRLIEQELTEIRKAQNVTAKPVMKVLRQGLGLEVTEEVKKWLCS